MFVGEMLLSSSWLLILLLVVVVLPAVVLLWSSWSRTIGLGDLKEGNLLWLWSRRCSCSATGGSVDMVAACVWQHEWYLACMYILYYYSRKERTGQLMDREEEEEEEEEREAG